LLSIIGMPRCDERDIVRISSPLVRRETSHGRRTAGRLARIGRGVEMAVTQALRSHQRQPSGWSANWLNVQNTWASLPPSLRM